MADAISNCWKLFRPKTYFLWEIINWCQKIGDRIIIISQITHYVTQRDRASASGPWYTATINWAPKYTSINTQYSESIRVAIYKLQGSIYSSENRLSMCKNQQEFRKLEAWLTGYHAEPYQRPTLMSGLNTASDSAHFSTYSSQKCVTYAGRFPVDQPR